MIKKKKKNDSQKSESPSFNPFIKYFSNHLRFCFCYSKCLL